MRIPLVALSLSLAACAPDRADAIQRAAEAYCDRSVACGWSEESERPDCEDGAEEFFDLAWPSGECADGGIDRAGWAACMDTLDTLNCSDWTQGLTSLGACDAQTVCRG